MLHNIIFSGLSQQALACRLAAAIRVRKSGYASSDQHRHIHSFSLYLKLETLEEVLETT